MKKHVTEYFYDKSGRVTRTEIYQIEVVEGLKTITPSEHLKNDRPTEMVPIRKPRKTADYGRKINAKQARQIRRLLALGMKNKTVAKDFGLSPHTVSQIKHRNIWKNA